MPASSFASENVAHDRVIAWAGVSDSIGEECAGTVTVKPQVSLPLYAARMVAPGTTGTICSL